MAERAAAYVRLSDPNDLTSASLDTQEASCREWCAEHDVEVARVYRERHTGVEVWERPELQRLIGDAQAGRYDLIVFHATDRLSRDPEHLAAIKVMVAMGGARLACVTEPIPDDDTGQLVSYIRGWSAKSEWNKIRERTVRGKRAKVERGLLLGSGVALYGYDKDRERGKLVIKASEAAVVRRIYRWSAEGHGCLAIARMLDAAGEPPPSVGKMRVSETPRWSKSQVHRILTNPTYMGRAYGWRWARGQWSPRPVEEWVPLADDAAPIIVSPERWSEVQGRLRGPQGAATRNAARPYLLRGRIVCARCGAALRPEVMKGHTYYRCGSRDTIDGACGARMVPVRAADAWAWEHVRRALGTEDAVGQMLADRAHEDVTELERELGAARARIAEIVERQARLVRRASTADDATWAVWERELRAREQERQREERFILGLEARLTTARASAHEARQLGEWCARIAVRLDTLAFAERALALDVLEVRVTAEGRDPAGWSLAPDWLA